MYTLKRNNTNGNVFMCPSIGIYAIIYCPQSQQSVSFLITQCLNPSSFNSYSSEDWLGTSVEASQSSPCRYVSGTSDSTQHISSVSRTWSQ